MLFGYEYVIHCSDSTNILTTFQDFYSTFFCFTELLVIIQKIIYIQSNSKLITDFAAKLKSVSNTNLGSNDNSELGKEGRICIYQCRWRLLNILGVHSIIEFL